MVASGRRLVELQLGPDKVRGTFVNDSDLELKEG